jgi:hypothetical protein
MTDEQREGLEWIRSRPPEVRALMRRFPPSCKVVATTPLRCPAPGRVGVIISTYLGGAEVWVSSGVAARRRVLRHDAELGEPRTGRRRHPADLGALMRNRPYQGAWTVTHPIATQPPEDLPDPLWCRCRPPGEGLFEQVLHETREAARRWMDRAPLEGS